MLHDFELHLWGFWPNPRGLAKFVVGGRMVGMVGTVVWCSSRTGAE